MPISGTEALRNWTILLGGISVNAMKIVLLPYWVRLKQAFDIS